MLEADETPAGPPAGRCTGSSCSTAEKVALAATVAGQSARIWSVAGRAARALPGSFVESLLGRHGAEQMDKPP
jgi:hypothetical protein